MTSKALSWFKRYALVWYFILTYAISWSFMIPVAVAAQGLVDWNVPSALYYFASFGPMASTLIVTAITEGRAGLGNLLGRLLHGRLAFRYYAFSVGLPFALFGLSAATRLLTSGSWPDLSLLGKLDYLPSPGILGALGVWLLTYGMGEEVGWRCFALPHLQKNRTAASSALILGVLWTLWHTPAFFFRDTYMAMGVFVLPAVFISVTFASVIFTWLYNATQGSLLVVILFHALFDWLATSEAGGQYASLVMGAGAAAWAVYIMRRYGPENAAPLPKQIPASA